MKTEEGLFELAGEIHPRFAQFQTVVDEQIDDVVFDEFDAVFLGWILSVFFKRAFNPVGCAAQFDEGVLSAHVAQLIGNLHLSVVAGFLSAHPLFAEVELIFLCSHLQAKFGDALSDGHLVLALGTGHFLLFKSRCGDDLQFVSTVRAFDGYVHKVSVFRESVLMLRRWWCRHRWNSLACRRPSVPSCCRSHRPVWAWEYVLH